MNLKDLTLFVTLVDAGSFTAAGELLGMPKSTVSRRISQLEQEIGIRLLRRTTRRISLTDAGRACYDHFLRVNAQTDGFIELLRAEDCEPSGRIRLVMPVEFSESEITSTLFQFCSRFPKIELIIDLDVRQGVGVQHLDLLKENLDLALVIGDPGIQTLVARDTGTTRMELFASPDYLKVHGSPSTPDELVQHELLYMPESVNTPYSKLPSGLRFPSSLLSNNVLILRKAALAGLGIGTLPVWLCERALERGELVKVMDGFIAGEATIYLLYPDRFLPRRTRLLVDYLMDKETPLPWSR